MSTDEYFGRFGFVERIEDILRRRLDMTIASIFSPMEFWEINIELTVSDRFDDGLIDLNRAKLGTPLKGTVGAIEAVPLTVRTALNTGTVPYPSHPNAPSFDRMWKY